MATKRRLTVEFDSSLADALEAVAAEESGLEGKIPVSRIVRTACVEFLRCRNGSDNSQTGLKSTLQPLSRGRVQV